MVLVPPDDHRALARAIEELFAAGPEELGAKARETVRRHFTWERCGAATVEAYRAALERAR
jgi:glycosyltransferase involved in cell wall biosynthesis